MSQITQSHSRSRGQLVRLKVELRKSASVVSLQMSVMWYISIFHSTSVSRLLQRDLKSGVLNANKRKQEVSN